MRLPRTNRTKERDRWLRRCFFLFDQCLYDAAKGSHIEVMRLLRECGASDWGFAMREAAAKGQLLAMQELNQWFVSAISHSVDSLGEAAGKLQRDHREAIEVALCAAAGGGHAILKQYSGPSKWAPQTTMKRWNGQRVRVNSTQCVVFTTIKRGGYGAAQRPKSATRR